MAAIPRRSGYRALITTELADYFIDFEHNHGIKLDADQRAWYGHAEKDRSRLHAQGVPELSGGGLQGFNRGGLLQDADDQGPREASTTGPAMAATPCKSEPAASFPSISRHRMTGTKVSRGRHQRGQHKEQKKRRSEHLAYGSIRSAWRPRAVVTGPKTYTKQGTCSILP